MSCGVQQRKGGVEIFIGLKGRWISGYRPMRIEWSWNGRGDESSNHHPHLCIRACSPLTPSAPAFTRHDTLLAARTFSNTSPSTTSASTQNKPMSGEQFWKQKECYIRGSTIKYCRVADSVIDQVKETEEAARKQRQQGGGGLSGGVSLGARGGGRGNHRGSRGGGPDRGRGSARGRGRGQ
ncbi:hypothetical protein L1887_42329 [Cichorium endivia]|nr:hypothetical protein L1887_42329 [Cichorium endivia]